MNIHLSWLKQFAQNITQSIEGAYSPGSNLEEVIAHWSSQLTYGSALILLVLVVVASQVKDRVPKLKLPLFIMMTTVMAGSILFLGASTIYLNVKSDSGGPVHWHADIEVWACGNELELRDPFEFLSNKIGTATLHEHDDKRIHLEGVVVDESKDASLGKFFYVIDGALTASDLVVPLNSLEAGNIYENEFDGDGPANAAPGLVEPYVLNGDDGRYAKFTSGQTCGDETAYVQTFVYTYDEQTKTYRQQKLADPVTYSISREPNVPPGDCLIIEFDVLKDHTDKLCEQYGVRDVDRCHEFGVTAEQSSICEARQINYPSTDPNQDQLDNNSTMQQQTSSALPEWPYDIGELSDSQIQTLRHDCSQQSQLPVGISAQCAALQEYETGEEDA